MPHLRSILAPVAIVAFASVATAGIPQVLDRIPADAHAIVAVEGIDKLDQNASHLLTAIELRAISTLSQALGALGLRDGLDLKASAAGVLYPPLTPLAPANPDAPREGEPEVAAVAVPRMVLLLPIPDFTSYLARLKATPDGSLHTFQYAGATYYARDLGDALAAFGPDRDLIASFDASHGRLAPRMSALGPRAQSLAEAADIVALASLNDLLPLLEGAFAPLISGLPPTPLNAAPGGGGGAADADPRVAIGRNLLAKLSSQSGPAMLALRAGPLGLRADLTMHFQKGSELAALATGGPAHQSALRALPKMDYLFLASCNLAHPGLRALINQTIPPEEPGLTPRDAPAALLSSLRAIQTVDTAAIGVFTPPNLLAGALARTTLVWEAADAAPAADAFRTLVRSIKPEKPGAPASSISREGAPTGAEKWTIALSPDAAASGATMMLFGFNQTLGGFLATTPTRGVLTWSTDVPLFAASFNAAQSDDPQGAISADPMLSLVAASLPDDRCIEWYLNARPILQQALPFLSMASSGAPQPKLPDALPPIGVAFSLADSSMHASAFLPSPLLRVAVGVMNSMSPPVAAPIDPKAPAGRKSK